MSDLSVCFFAAIAITSSACAASEPGDPETPLVDAGNMEPADMDPGTTDPQTCGDGVSDFIYFLATPATSGQLTLYKLAPSTLALTEVAPLVCDDLIGVLPSVTVDRTGNLWMVHPSGAIYRAPITGGACTLAPSSDVEPDDTYSVSSAAFVSDPANPGTESLVSVSIKTSSAPTFLRRTAPATITTQPIVTLSPAQSPVAVAPGGGRIPIITGTGDGRLFSLSQPVNGGLTQLTEIDPATGLQKGLAHVFASEFSNANGAAFAFFGGDFYLFTYHGGSQGTQFLQQLVVTRYRIATETASVVASFGDISPLGAGVSTCAPTVLL